MRRSAARPTTDLSAYDLYLRALAIFFPITRERVFKALGLFEQAIAIDRHYGPVLSWAAICHLRLVDDGWRGESGANPSLKCNSRSLKNQTLISMGLWIIPGS